MFRIWLARAVVLVAGILSLATTAVVDPCDENEGEWLETYRDVGPFLTNNQVLRVSMSSSTSCPELVESSEYAEVECPGGTGSNAENEVSDYCHIHTCISIYAPLEVTRVSARLSVCNQKRRLQSTVFDWSLEVDDTCGRACAEFATELTTEWSFLECAESGETCHCEGVNIENIEFEGSFTVSNDGLVITPAEALSDPSVPIYKVPVCADTQYLNVYSEELGNLVLSRKD